jgi:hypothetical protein
VGLPEIVFGSLLIAVLLALAPFYAWRQLRALRQLRRAPDLPAAEADHLRRQVRRRLAGCALMLVLAGLLGGALVYLEEPAQRRADESDARGDAPPPPLTPEDRHFLRLYGWYWIATLLVLLALVLLAAFDLWATRRYAWREHRKIQDDRRAMIERQVQRLRQSRNGQGG